MSLLWSPNYARVHSTRSYELRGQLEERIDMEEAQIQAKRAAMDQSATRVGTRMGQFFDARIINTGSTTTCPFLTSPVSLIRVIKS